MMTNTLHLSPTIDRIDATPRQSLWQCGCGGKGNRAGTFLCSGFTDVLGFKKCAFLRGFGTVTHIARVTNIYQGVTIYETSPYRFQRAWFPLRQPTGFGCDRRAPAQSDASTRGRLSRPFGYPAFASVRLASRSPA